MEINESEEQLIPEKAKKKQGKKVLPYERIRASFEQFQLAWVRSSLTVMTIGVGTDEYYYGRIESGKDALSSTVTGEKAGIILMSLAVCMLVFFTMPTYPKYEEA